MANPYPTVRDAVSALEAAVGDWANLTQAQKNAAVREALKVVAVVGRRFMGVDDA